MSLSSAARRPPFDAVTRDIAAYVDGYRIDSTAARDAALHCLLDSLGCAFEARAVPECAAMLGPVAPGTIVPNGARVPATSHVLDPVKAAFDTVALVRWLDYNDAYYGETVIHPSDCIGALLAVSDWRSRTLLGQDRAPLAVADLLDATIKAYEIAGQLAVANAFTTGMGLDHVILVKVACAAVVTRMLGGTRAEIMNAVSNAWLDGQTLATFRRGAAAGARKSWAAADAAARGVWLALVATAGEMGYPAALSEKTWGFCAVHNRGRPLRVAWPYGTAVIENVQFKLAYPAAFHAQTAAEAAIALHPQVCKRLHEIRRVELWTHEYAKALLDRNGALRNVAERDHSLQYIAAVGLITGDLTPTDYTDVRAADPRIDRLRAAMTLAVDPRFTRGFRDPARRANANAIRVHFRDGTATPRMTVEFPVGHPRRRAEGIPLLMRKFESGLARVYAPAHARRIHALTSNRARLAATPVNELLDLLQTGT